MSANWSLRVAFEILVASLICLASFFLITNYTNLLTCQDPKKVPDDSEWCYKGMPGADIARCRGFVAEDHQVVTSQGYIIGLERILNPLINEGTRGLSSKRPILFIPGRTAIGGYFLLNTKHGQPKDLSKIDTNNRTLESLIVEFQNDPIATSLPLFASCFGHDIWLMNMRGVPKSDKHVTYDAWKNGSHSMLQFEDDDEEINDCSDVKLDDTPLEYFRKQLERYEATIGREYWNFTMDDVAAIDIPEVIDYILNVTGSDKLAIVTHSVGSQLVLMSMANKPELTKKLSLTVAWSPVYMIEPPWIIQNIPSHMSNHRAYGLKIVYPLLKSYQGPWTVSPRTSKKAVCLQNILCEATFGKESCRDTTVYFPDFIKDDPSFDDANLWLTGFPVGSKYELQYIRNKMFGWPRYYDYGSRELNMKFYGQPEPPIYDISVINSTVFSLYNAHYDQTYLPRSTDILIESLQVPVIHHYIDIPGVQFGHLSQIQHELTPPLVIVPSLKELGAF